MSTESAANHRAPAGGGVTDSDVAWYSRPELSGAWTIPACAIHGALLEAHRFLHRGRTLDRPGIGPRAAERCEICRDPGIIEQVESCTCEREPWRCPAHQNLGCGG
ncbi:MAG TPA: hypothetical protein VNZ57_10865 [Longimicrobiales bacterium]|nr:hypothetical protein [Longimicrobiales bacterium]